MHQASARRARRRALTLTTAVILATLVPSPAQGHRDGCHRWHSCPSDSGSYVCGDLGYDSECPGGDDEESSEVWTAPSDVTAPDPPEITSARPGKGGTVVLTFRAERGSRVVVQDEHDRIVARADGRGSAQSLTFRGRSGNHSYALRATDSAGNESLEADAVSIRTDAKPPPLGDVVSDPARPDHEATVVRFTTDPGTRYTVRVVGRKTTLRGTASAGEVREELWLPNGRYRYRLTARDPAGNTTSVERAFAVSIRRPAVRVTRLTATNVSPVIFRVTASPRSTGLFRIADLPAVRFDLRKKSAVDVPVRIRDGLHEVATVTLTDFQNRTASASVPPFTVDTTAPALSLYSDESAAEDGRLAVSFRTDPGARVLLVATGSGEPIRRAVTGGPSRTEGIRRAVPEGSYEVRATATDAAGNHTDRTIRVRVQDPVTWSEILLWMLLLGALVAALAWLRRNWHRVTRWQEKRHRATVDRERRRAAEAERLAYQQAIATYHLTVGRFQAEHSAWATRLEHLRDLLSLAESHTSSVPESLDLVRLKRGETVYARFEGSLVEQRRRGGQPFLVTVGPGSVVLTDRRVVFVGDKKREWAHEHTLHVEHLDQGVTLIDVSNRQTLSGIAYHQDPERIRLLLDLARADPEGRRGDVVKAMRLVLAQHASGEPTPPPVPQPRTPETVASPLSANG